MMYSLTDVVKNLLIINVIVFFAVHMLFLQTLGDYFVYYPYDSDGFRPIQIVTHMFNHAHIPHLFFNMLSLFFFGPNVERMWGPRRFLFFYLVCGLGSLLLHITIGGNSAVVGASGAIAGVLLAFAYLFPNAKIMLLIPPIPIKAKYLVAMLLAFDLYMGITNSNTGIAHFAHIGGALAGAGLIFVFKKNPNFMR